MFAGLEDNTEVTSQPSQPSQIEEAEPSTASIGNSGVHSKLPRKHIIFSAVQKSSICVAAVFTSCYLPAALRCDLDTSEFPILDAVVA